jgi:hypothetical protein
MSVSQHESCSKHNSKLHNLHDELVIGKTGQNLAEKVICHVVQYHIEGDLHQDT